MILTENHAIQISAILVEAAEQQGDKKGLIERVKGFFKRIVDAIKEKVGKFVKFLAEKMKPLSGLFAKAKEKLAAFAKEKARQKDSYNVYMSKLLVDGITDLPVLLKLQNDFVNQVLSKADATDEEKAEALKDAVEQINVAVKGAPALAALNKALGDHESGKKAIKISLTEAVRLLDKMIKTSKVVEGTSQKYIKQLEAYNKKLINFYKAYDGQKVSAFTSLTTKVYSTVNVFLVALSRSVTAFIFAVGNIVRGTKVDVGDALNDQMDKKYGYRQ